MTLGCLHAFNTSSLLITVRPQLLDSRRSVIGGPIARMVMVMWLRSRSLPQPSGPFFIVAMSFVRVLARLALLQTKMLEAGFRGLFQRLELIAGLETGVEHTADDGGQDQVDQSFSGIRLNTGCS